MHTPNTAKKLIEQKCPICKKVFRSKEYLVYHIESNHRESIPKTWSASRYENYLRTGNEQGMCVMCKKPTTWNESTWKYNRFCDNKRCRDKYVQYVDNNMIRAYGKVHLLNDAEMQRKMIYNKHTSGVYMFSTDDKKEYPYHWASKMELKFAKMLDVFLNFSAKYILSPSPHTYQYLYKGEYHNYIPDVYIIPYNLEVEIKEPLNNQNMHPKIQSVDKVKERLKDDLMKSISDINYIKINGEDYSEFFELLSVLKNKDTCFPNAKLTTRLDDPPISSEERIKNQITERMNALNDKRFFNNLIISKVNQEEFCISKDRERHLSRLERLKYLIEDMDYSQSYYYSKILDMYENSLDNVCKEAFYYIKNNIKPVFKDRILQLQESYMTNIEMPYDACYYLNNQTNDHTLGNKVLFKPIYILLSYTDTMMGKFIEVATRQSYSHVSISLDTSLEQMYSFGFLEDGKIGYYSTESIRMNGYLNNKAYCAMYVYMCPSYEYNIIVDNLIKNSNERIEELKYSVEKLFNIFLDKEVDDPDKYFCSEFVVKLLSLGGNDKLLNKHGVYASPSEFFKISNGNIRDYDKQKVDRKMSSYLRERGYVDVTLEK